MPHAAGKKTRIFCMYVYVGSTYVFVVFAEIRECLTNTNKLRIYLSILDHQHRRFRGDGWSCRA